MVGIATGTAVFLSALPLISLPTVGTTHLASKQSKLMHIQKILSEAHATNKDFYGVKQTSKVFYICYLFEFCKKKKKIISNLSLLGWRVRVQQVVRL